VLGESIGSYRITAKLGEGGMGTVYLGEHQFIARRAAIKVLLPELSVKKDIVQRFFNEARATAAIHHPGIVEIADCAVLPAGNAYIVMELLEGESLGSYLRKEARLSVQRAAHLTRYIADALAAAHDKHIAHRDLKPDNVFVLSAEGAPSPIKILDFGIAKLLNTEGGQGHRTRTGSLIGTPVYMSPEQCRGTGEIDHRTDIYSLGCILFEMLCGRPPFTHEGFGELIQSHLSVVPPRIGSFDSSFPPSVEALVARLLAKSPADRPQTMRALIEELDAAMGDEPPATAALPAQSHSAAPLQRTRLLPPPDRPRVQTTLRSASGERLARAEPGSPPPVLGRRRTGPFIAGAALAVVFGGVALWRMSAKPTGEKAKDRDLERAIVPSSQALEAPNTAVAAAPAELPAAPPTLARLPSAPAPQPATSAPHQPSLVVAADEAAPPPVASHPTLTRTIKVAITSQPPGADVCLEKDRILLGRTKLDWKTEKRSGTAKVLIRKRGYRGEEITLDLEHDTRTAVTLDKLGPDDIDDLDTCEKR
jgi:serine/threonine protein kinase